MTRLKRKTNSGEIMFAGFCRFMCFVFTAGVICVVIKGTNIPDCFIGALICFWFTCALLGWEK
jgi:hypothetical protein